MSITPDIQRRVAACEVEMNSVLKERSDVVHGMWVARVAHQHLVMLGPGGTGKSFLVREFAGHISDAVYFETALDETKDPGEVFGPPDIQAMVHERRVRRVVDGMLPEATDAFVDEIFNGNSPTLHSLQPMMNERLFHNPTPFAVPLRSLFAGTNKLLDSDPDLAPFFDRLHLRYDVSYIKSRRNQIDMVTEAIARKSLGQGLTSLQTSLTTQVTVAELDTAHYESLALNVDDEVFGAFVDLREALRSEGGIVISDRRMVDGMQAVMANAWVRGHDEVRIPDLDILVSMWWTRLEEAPKARDIILEVANPTEKLTLELMTELEKLQDQYDNIDSVRASTTRTSVKVELMRNARKLKSEAGEYLTEATAAGGDTTRLRDLIARAQAFENRVEDDAIGASDRTRLTTVN